MGYNSKIDKDASNSIGERYEWVQENLVDLLEYAYTINVRFSGDPLMPEFEDNDLTSGEVIEEAGNETVEPDMYRVLLHNDHYTAMDFVVEVLQAVFHKQLLEAIKIMLDVHRRGIGIAGTYTFDVARTKTGQVKNMAEAREFPLRCTYEKV